MKTYLFTFLLVIGFIAGCDTQNKTIAAASKPTGTANDTVRIANDELEYEVLIFDPGFNTWLQSVAKPRNYYSQQYLEQKNRIWVIEWNRRAMQPRYAELYQTNIDYQQQIDYGYEVNYLLYNYLVYFQNANNQRLGGLVPQS